MIRATRCGKVGGRDPDGDAAQDPIRFECVGNIFYLFLFNIFLAATTQPSIQGFFISGTAGRQSVLLLKPRSL